MLVTLFGIVRSAGREHAARAQAVGVGDQIPQVRIAPERRGNRAHRVPRAHRIERRRGGRETRIDRLVVLIEVRGRNRLPVLVCVRFRGAAPARQRLGVGNVQRTVVADIADAMALQVVESVVLVDRAASDDALRVGDAASDLIAHQDLPCASFV